jgi:hypothetical protein
MEILFIGLLFGKRYLGSDLVTCGRILWKAPTPVFHRKADESINGAEKWHHKGRAACSSTISYSITSHKRALFIPFADTLFAAFLVFISIKTIYLNDKKILFQIICCYQIEKF